MTMDRMKMVVNVGNVVVSIIVISGSAEGMAMTLKRREVKGVCENHMSSCGMEENRSSCYCTGEASLPDDVQHDCDV